MPDENVIDMGIQKAPEDNIGEDLSLAIAVIVQWRKILNARLLALLALVGALSMFTFALYEPSSLRLGGATLYSVGVLWPVMWLFLKKG